MDRLRQSDTGQQSQLCPSKTCALIGQLVGMSLIDCFDFLVDNQHSLGIDEAGGIVGIERCKSEPADPILAVEVRVVNSPEEATDSKLTGLVRKHSCEHIAHERLNLNLLA
ncbi:MAG: hypothetical protein KDE27_22635 [Planctomycetes bacterium]|nr:hypothetical protein [Planctomycetota bacterium]